MANNNNESADNSPDSSKESGLDKSFVGKFVSGLLHNTPLSKWFGKESPKSVVRRREDDDDDEDPAYIFQPPVKRAKLPSNTDHNNFSAHLFESPVTVHNASNNVNNNNVAARVLAGRFPEPVAGPSGVQSRKLFETHNSTASTNTVSSSFESQNAGICENNDSDSEESTSDYCSAPGLANRVTDDTKTVASVEVYKKTTPKTRSLFASTEDDSGPHHSRTLFPEKSPPAASSSSLNTSLSSRRPTFNASTFGSPNFIDRTLSTRQILNSPFYNGHTIYGGASAYGRRLGRSAEDLNTSTRVSVQIKPVNEKKTPSNSRGGDNTTLSKTARRILTTLEQYSTPISDAKKIPVATRKQTGILGRYMGASPYSSREKKRPFNQELQVPSIPELLQMKQKEKLQNSTVSVRRIATTSKSALNKEEYKLRTADDDAGGGHKHSNKMKSSIVSSLRHKRTQEDIGESPVSEVKLPKVSLPITTLPKFDFELMPPHTTDKLKINSRQGERKKPVENGKTVFTFSEPLVISEDLKAVSAINCFKFSEPVCKKRCSDMAIKAGDLNTSPGFKLKNNGETLKTKERSKWECQTCLVRNDTDTVQCIACHEPKPKLEESSKKDGFGDQFKLSSDKWECGSCMVRNLNTDTVCVACGTTSTVKPKSSSHSRKTWMCNSCSIINTADLERCTSCLKLKTDPPPVVASFGDKFRPSSDTWECTVCMIRNKKSLVTCEACQTARPKPKSVRFDESTTFRPASDTWECPTCMIRNKNNVLKCPACETVKPGEKEVALVPSTKVSTSTTFTFGILSEWECKTCLVKNREDLSKCASCGSLRDKDKTGFGNVFKIKEGEWDCTGCLVRNKGGVDVCACCGVSRSGTDKKKEEEEEEEPQVKKPMGFNLALDKSPVMFKFGIPPVSKTDDSTVVSLASSGTTTTTTSSMILTSVPITSTPPPPPPSSLSFVFGDPTKSIVTTAPATTPFTFGIGTQEKSALTSTSETTATVLSQNSNNPLLKPNERLPEKAMPAPVGFKFGLDTSLGQQKPIIGSSESSTNNNSNKTDAPVIFSSGFEPPPAAVKSTIPTFHFKPTTINGDVSKLKESPFSGKSSSDMFASSKPPGVESNLFAKPPENTNLFTSKPTEGLFSSKPNDALFQTKPGENMFAMKPVEGGNMFASKSADNSNLFSSKAVDGGNLFSSKSTEGGNLFASKPAVEGNLFANKPTDVGSNLFSSKPATEGGNLFSPKVAESGNLFGSKPVAEGNNLFSPKPTTEGSNLFASKPPDGGNLFSTKPVESGGGGNMFANKATDGGNLFSSKPAENSLFSTKPTDNTGGLFASKPVETNLFSNKPADSSGGGGGLFSSPPAFKFNVKPNEIASSSTSSSTVVNQQPPEVNPGHIFKFGTESSGQHSSMIPMKKFGESTDNSVSNGFGGVAKISAFGAPQQQPFGTPENKPFTFDSAPKNTSFSFGQQQQQQQPPPPPPQQQQPEKIMTSPIFNFGGGGGGGATTSSTPGSGFSFSSPSSGFNFGGAKVESKPFGVAVAPPPLSQSNSVFGGGAQTAAASNGSFNFGTSSNNNNQKAIFTFGAGQANNQPQQPGFPTQNQPGFNFGVAAPTAVATGGFNFTGAPPSFSFTDGTQSAAPPTRKIKKALRRTHR